MRGLESHGMLLSAPAKTTASKPASSLPPSPTTSRLAPKSASLSVLKVPQADHAARPLCPGLAQRSTLTDFQQNAAQHGTTQVDLRRGPLAFSRWPATPLLRVACHQPLRHIRQHRFPILVINPPHPVEVRVRPGIVRRYAPQAPSPILAATRGATPPALPCSHTSRSAIRSPEPQNPYPQFRG